MRLREVFAANVKPDDVIGGEIRVSERRPFAEFAHALTVDDVQEFVDPETGRVSTVRFRWSYSDEAFSPLFSIVDKLVVIES